MTQYGIAIVNVGTDWKPRKHQRYFYEYEEDEQGLTVDVRLLAGKWVKVNRKAVVRWPVREDQ